MVEKSHALSPFYNSAGSGGDGAPSPVVGGSASRSRAGSTVWSSWRGRMRALLVVCLQPSKRARGCIVTPVLALSRKSVRFVIFNPCAAILRDSARPWLAFPFSSASPKCIHEGPLCPQRSGCFRRLHCLCLAFSFLQHLFNSLY